MRKKGNAFEKGKGQGGVSIRCQRGNREEMEGKKGVIKRENWNCRINVKEMREKQLKREKEKKKRKGKLNLI